MSDKAMAAPVCEHYWAWVSPAGAAGSARLCMSCHQPSADWLNEIDANEAQIRDLLEEREELLTEIRRLRMGNHPAGRALRATCHRCGRDGPAHSLGGVAGDCIYMPYPDAPDLALAEALTERDAEHEGGA